MTRNYSENTIYGILNLIGDVKDELVVRLLFERINQATSGGLEEVESEVSGSDVVLWNTVDAGSDAFHSGELYVGEAATAET